jgi:putative membrane protein
MADDKKSDDQTFVQKANEINLGESRIGELTQKNASNDAIKKFGERMVQDHSQLNKELREIASKKGITLPDQLDQKHQDLMDQLMKLNGANFDRTFAKDMVSGHEKAIEVFEAEVKNGQDPDIKAWAEKSLPTLREHLRLAKAAAKSVNGEK